MKKSKEEKKPRKRKKEVYVEKAGLLGEAIDYHVYHMRSIDYMIGFLIGFVIAFAVVYIFFEVMIPGIISGTIVGFFSIKPYRSYLRKKRNKTLLLQFRDLLESLSASYSAGQNTIGAFQDACNDMKLLFGEKAYITKEVEMIVQGLNNNLTIEALLKNFAERAESVDIDSFADIFENSNRLGSNIKTIVTQTRDIINDKIEIEMEIETVISNNKSELYIMTVMPIAIVYALKLMGNDALAANNPVNIVTRVVVLFVVIVAFLIGKKITDIKI